MKILEPRRAPRDHGEKNTEQRNTTEENEINVRQLTRGSNGLGSEWMHLTDLPGILSVISVVRGVRVAVAFVALPHVRCGAGCREIGLGSDAEDPRRGSSLGARD